MKVFQDLLVKRRKRCDVPLGAGVLHDRLPDTEEKRSEVVAYLDPVCEVVRLVEVNFFAGRSD